MFLGKMPGLRPYELLLRLDIWKSTRPVDPWIVEIVLPSLDQQNRKVSVQSRQSACNHTASRAP